MAEKLEVLIVGKDQFSKVFKGIGTALGTSFKFAVAGAATALAVLTAEMGFAVKEAMEWESMQAQLNAVLTSTKGVAGITADAANELANEFQNLTKFSNTAVLGAENILLTFTKIGQDVFPQTLETVLDMSTALGQDLKSSAIQLGKALNDPILGITALSRVGVNFTQIQRDMIKNMVDLGDVAGAQRLILEELNTEFGGSAKAAGDTASGAWAQVKNAFADIQREIGLKFLPTIKTALVDLLPKLKAFGDRLVESISATDIKNFVERAVNGMMSFVEWMFENIPKMISFISDKIGIISGIMSALSDVVAVLFSGVSAVITGDWQIAWDNFKQIPEFALDAFVLMIEGVLGIFLPDKAKAVGDVLFKVGMDIISFVSETFGPAFEQFKATMAEAWATIVKTWETHGELIKEILIRLVEFFASIIVRYTDIFNTVLLAFSAFMDGIQALIDGKWAEAWDNFKKIPKIVLDGVILVVSEFINGLSKLFGDSIGRFINIGRDIIIWIIIGIWNEAGRLYQEIVNLVQGAINDVKNLVNFFQLGIDIVVGIANGIMSYASYLYQVVRNLVASAFAAAKAALGIGSPSKLFADEVGTPIIDGIIAGIRGGQAALLDTMRAAMPTPALAGATGGDTRNIDQSIRQDVTINVYGDNAYDQAQALRELVKLQGVYR